MSCPIRICKIQCENTKWNQVFIYVGCHILSPASRVTSEWMMVSLVHTSISLGLELPLRQKCYPCCHGHPQLTGPLQDFTCIFLSGVELELVLSCHLFCQFSLVASESLSNISLSMSLSKGCLLKLVCENVTVLIVSEKRQKPRIAHQSLKQNELVTCSLSQLT
jgi:hypothetical protein